MVNVAIADRSNSAVGVSSAPSAGRVSPVPAELSPPAPPPKASSPVPIAKTASAEKTGSQKKILKSSGDDMITSGWGIEEPVRKPSTSSSRRTRNSTLDRNSNANTDSDISSFASRAITKAANRAPENKGATNEREFNFSTSEFFPKDNNTGENTIMEVDMHFDSNQSPSTSRRCTSKIPPSSCKKSKTFSLNLDAMSPPPPPDADGWIHGSAQHRGLTASASQRRATPPRANVGTKAVPSPVRAINLASSTAEVEYDVPGSPVVVERQLDLKPYISNAEVMNSSSASSDVAVSRLRNVKRFRKNRVRGVFEPVEGAADNGFQTRPRDVGLSVKEMDKVLPKESERELQVNTVL